MGDHHDYRVPSIDLLTAPFQTDPGDPAAVPPKTAKYKIATSLVMFGDHTECFLAKGRSSKTSSELRLRTTPPPPYDELSSGSFCVLSYEGIAKQISLTDPADIQDVTISKADVFMSEYLLMDNTTNALPKKDGCFLPKPYDVGTIEIITEKITYYTDSGLTGKEPIPLLKPETYFKEDGRIPDPKPLTPEDFHLTVNECPVTTPPAEPSCDAKAIAKAIQEAKDALKLNPTDTALQAALIKVKLKICVSSAVVRFTRLKALSTSIVAKWELIKKGTEGEISYELTESGATNVVKALYADVLKTNLPEAKKAMDDVFKELEEDPIRDYNHPLKEKYEELKKNYEAILKAVNTQSVTLTPLISEAETEGANLKMETNNTKKSYVKLIRAFKIAKGGGDPRCLLETIADDSPGMTRLVKIQRPATAADMIKEADAFPTKMEYTKAKPEANCGLLPVLPSPATGTPPEGILNLN
jgi:hypothetical protein